MKLFLHEQPSPIGKIQIVSDGKTIRALDFSDYEERMLRLLRIHYGEIEMTRSPMPAAYRSAIEAYFAGEFEALDRLPVETAGTAFQREVWIALRNIPAGTTTSYGELAARIGRPKACRAVGLANGSNPIPLILPCHRVIGTNGSLTGYGGGLDRKRWLLTHERVLLA